MESIIEFFTPEIIWILVGIVFFVIELALPSFIISFFGLGAIITAIISWLGFTNDLGYQLLVFLSSSILSLILLRRWLKTSFSGDINKEQKPGAKQDDIAGEIVKVREAISPDSKGKVLYHGTLWEAVSSEKLPAGSNVRISGRKNITLEVKSLYSKE